MRSGAFMESKQDNGIVDRASEHSVNETLRRLEERLQSKGVVLFAVVDHSGEAEKAGLTMPPTKLAIFGNPKAGTPLTAKCGSRTTALHTLLRAMVCRRRCSRTSRSLKHSRSRSVSSL